MTAPDHNQDQDKDLRDAFRRCRAEDASSAPVFPGLSMPRPTRPPVPFRIPATIAGAVAVVAALVAFVRPPSPPSSTMTLAEAMPRPLLRAASADPLFRMVGPMEVASDFLLPSYPQTQFLLFP